jgi:hypothetical protein
MLDRCVLPSTTGTPRWSSLSKRAMYDRTLAGRFRL